MLCTYMKKISITFNEYEYRYLKYARDVANENYLVNADIKDILYSILIYTRSSIKDGRHMIKFTNIFLIKNNAKPIESGEVEPEGYTKIKDVYFKTLADPTLGKVYSSPILYVVRLEDSLIQILEEIKKDILYKAPNIKEPSYSEIFRNSIHFVIDNYSFKSEFFSILYMIRLIPYTNVVNLVADFVSIDSNSLLVQDSDEEREIKFSEMPGHCKYIKDDYKTYTKLLDWILNTELKETMEEQRAISKKIGYYSNGYKASMSFIDFIFFLVGISESPDISIATLSHFSFDLVVSSYLEQARGLYIYTIEKIFTIMYDACIASNK